MLSVDVALFLLNNKNVNGNWSTSSRKHGSVQERISPEIQDTLGQCFPNWGHGVVKRGVRQGEGIVYSQ